MGTQHLNILLDATDREILRKRIKLYVARTGPRVGDFVQMPDGSLRRFSHDWGKDIQTTLPATGGGSFYLNEDGGVRYSGGLDSAVMKNRLKLISNRAMPGLFWFFHHGIPRAHNAVQCSINCEVYRYE